MSEAGSDSALASSAPTPVPWDIPPALDEGAVRFKDQVELATQALQSQVLDLHGGPMQYLEAKLQDVEQKRDFVTWLWGTFPSDESKEYALDSPIPSVDLKRRAETLPSRVHVSMLGFCGLCTLKPPPSAHASGLLVQRILNEGFDTGKPLLVKHVTPCDVMESPWASFTSGMPIPPFGLGYVKGMLRATTCLALLHLFWADGKGTALLRTFSKFKESCEVIYVQHVVLPSLESEIFNNFLLSIRDSVCKPPNFMTWIHTLRSLQKKGYEDSAAVIVRYNQLVPKSSHLVGSKAVALGNLMNLFPEDLIELLQSHVSKYGWDGCVLSDDALSSKRILPTYQHKAPHKSWNTLMAMSSEATTLLFKRLINEFEKPNSCKKKVDRSRVDAVAEAAALLVNLAKQLQEMFPISAADIETHVYQPWLDGAHGWDLELHEVQSERRDKWVVTDIKAFRNVADMCNCKVPLGPGSTTEILLTRLDEDKWSLVSKQLEYDLQCFRLHLSKVGSFELAVHHAKLDWSKKRHEEANRWAQQWLKNKGSVVAYDSSEVGALDRAVTEQLSVLLKHNGLQKHTVVTWLILNSNFSSCESVALWAML